MKHNPFGLIICMLFTVSLLGQSETVTTDSEVEAINQAVMRAYNAISFKPGTQPDFSAIEAAFLPDATFVSFRGGKQRKSTLAEYLSNYRSMIESGKVSSFQEVELGGKTEYFGHIGHRISAYGSYVNDSDKIVERGVNSFQVMKVDGQWLVYTVIWDVASEEQVIPSKYLDNTKQK